MENKMSNNSVTVNLTLTNGTPVSLQMNVRAPGRPLPNHRPFPQEYVWTISSIPQNACALYPNAWLNVYSPNSRSTGTTPLCQLGLGAGSDMGSPIQFSIVTVADGGDLLSNVVTISDPKAT